MRNLGIWLVIGLGMLVLFNLLGPSTSESHKITFSMMLCSICGLGKRPICLNSGMVLQIRKIRDGKFSLSELLHVKKKPKKHVSKRLVSPWRTGFFHFASALRLRMEYEIF